MNPLTIEELKALEINSEVWLVDRYIYPNGANVRFEEILDNTFFYRGYPYSGGCLFENYGIEWIAYKNKKERHR